MEELIGIFTGAGSAYVNVYIAILRWLAPALSLLLVLRCVKPLMTFRREPEIWAWLCPEGGKKLPVTHWENIIGRHKRSDIVIDFPTVSRNHAVLTRYDDGSWTIQDINSASGILLNGQPIQFDEVKPSDTITIGGIDMKLQPISAKQEKRLAQLRTRAAGPAESFANLLLLTVLQILLCIAYLFGSGEKAGSVVLGFGGIMATQWILLLFYMMIRRTSFEVETIAFFLCSMGMAAISAVKPHEAGKQLVALGLGVVTFLVVGWSVRDLERAKKIRHLAAAASVGLLLITLVFGKEYYGAKNWLVIGPLSIQPSELAKVCFVYAGASTLDRILSKKNLFLFIVYSAALCGCLALMNDFGTALIFFCAFLIIAFMRSGSIGTVALAVSSLAFAGVVALKIAPHALRRFSIWRNVWSDPLNAGYQQTRALMCMASGGLMGIGAGRGWMKNVFAADSDVVIATLGEEWGLIMVLILIVGVMALGVFAVRSTAVGRSSFYTIGACTAAGILLVQVMLNALGTVDVLPLTGVTFPFVSNGGSSMMAAWGLLALIKGADTRQNASFAVTLLKQRRDSEDE